MDASDRRRIRSMLLGYVLGNMERRGTMPPERDVPRPLVQTADHGLRRAATEAGYPTDPDEVAECRCGDDRGTEPTCPCGLPRGES